MSGEAFFPCVSTKNVAFSINFGGSPASCEAEGVEGYSFIQAAAEECRVPASEVHVYCVSDLIENSFC